MPKFGYKHTEATKLKMTLQRTGKKRKPLSDVHKKKISLSETGKIVSTETKKKISEAKLGKNLGEKSPRWKGGITPYRIRIRESAKYSEWRSSVFIRDNFICQKCGIRGEFLQAHHKKSFSKLLQEVRKYLPLFDIYTGAMIYSPLWEISNGITYCWKCHKIENKKQMRNNKYAIKKGGD